MKIGKLLIIVFCISSFFSCANKKALNRVIFDEKSQTEILYGFCSWKGLKAPPFDDWFKVGFQSYEPNFEIVSNIENSKVFSNVDVTIVMATWCSDSRREVPRFYKIMNNIDYDIELIKIINVDRKKEARGTPVSELNIERVPTFIFYRERTEVGRIVETPEESLEADILKILAGG